MLAKSVNTCDNVEMTPEQITFESFRVESLMEYSGLSDYVGLLEGIGEETLTEQFKRHFTFFYRVRRPEAWLSRYYDLLEEVRREDNPTFGSVLRRVDSFSDGRVEMSFSSKLLAIVRPELPIWDSQVRKTLGLRELSSSQSADLSTREREAEDRYSELCGICDGLLRNPMVKREIEKFRSALPERARKVSDMKLLDCFTWKAGK